MTMKKYIILLLMILGVTSITPVVGQKVNGKNFSFPEGKDGWSDTVFRKLQTAAMKEKAIQPVTLALRYRLLKEYSDGYRYAIEITNTSNDIPVKFKVTSAKGKESYTIRLDPKQTKVWKKSHWRTTTTASRTVTDRESDYFFDFKLDEENLRSKD